MDPADAFLRNSEARMPHFVLNLVPGSAGAFSVGVFGWGTRAQHISGAASAVHMDRGPKLFLLCDSEERGGKKRPSLI